MDKRCAGVILLMLQIGKATQEEPHAHKKSAHKTSKLAEKDAFRLFAVYGSINSKSKAVFPKLKRDLAEKGLLGM